MKANTFSKLLMTAAVAGLLSGSIANAQDKAPAKTDKKEAKKDGCSGKDGCKGKDMKKGKDGCKGKDMKKTKDGCKGKDSCKGHDTTKTKDGCNGMDSTKMGGKKPM